MEVPLGVVVGKTEPHWATEHVTLQVTPAVAGSWATVAVSCAVAPDCTLAVAGATVTVIAGIVTVIVLFFVLSATEDTVMVTVRSLAGGVVGAVYVVGVPLGVVVGETEPHCVTEHVTLQVTPLLAESFTTVAVNCIVPPACTVALVDERLMTTEFAPPLQPATRLNEQTHNAHAKRGRVLFMTASQSVLVVDDPDGTSGIPLMGRTLYQEKVAVNQILRPF